MNLRAIGLLLILLGTCTYLRSQDDPGRKKAPSPKKFLSTIPVRCILRDINVGFAQQIGLIRTIEGRVGWVHGNRLLHKQYNLWLNSSEMLYKGPSVYLQLNKWKINKKGRYTFSGIVIGYRYLYYTDRELTVYDRDGHNYDEVLTLSQWRNDIILLGTTGVGTTKISMTEISVGIQFMFTHTNVTGTQRVTSFSDQDEYDEYIKSRLGQIPNVEGFAMMPIIRITSRIGWFTW